MTQNWHKLSIVIGLTLGILVSPVTYAQDIKSEPKPQETLLLQSPDLSENHIAFVYARDIWICSREAAPGEEMLTARRLTSGLGIEFRPRFSPDGQWLAFSAQYEGNIDVYVVSIHGGVPRRLTYHPESDYVQDWDSQGKNILFTSYREHAPRVGRLYQIATSGGFPTRLQLPRVNHASLNKAGTHIAYTPISDAFGSWKRYRGGRVSPVWIFDRKTLEVEEVPHVRASDTLPTWFQDHVYFLSDRDKVMNLYVYKPGSKKVTQLTTFEQFDIRSLAAGPDYLIFAQAGRLHLFNTQAKAFKTLKIHALNDGLSARPKWVSGASRIRGYDISPAGNRAVFSARGEIVTLPKQKGFARTLSASPGAHDRNPNWSPDGRKIAWFSDASGEYQLHVQDCRGNKKATTYKLPAPHFYFQLKWSPDSQKIVFSDKSGRISLLNLKSKKITVVSNNIASLGVFVSSVSWHPESRYFAYEKANEQTGFSRVCIYDTQTSQSKALTDQFGFAENPCFSADGKMLYFFASVNIGPKLFGLNMSASASRRWNGHLYVVTLKQKTANPFLPKNDESTIIFDKPKKKPEKKADAEKEKKKKPVVVKVKKKSMTIDWAFIQQRILALPLKAGVYYNLEAVANGLLFIEQGKGLQHFELKKRKAKAVSASVRSFRLSANRKMMIANSGGRYLIGSISGKDLKPVPTQLIKVRVEPQAEWRQILHEAWRIQRDFFYDKNMHGVNWDDAWTRWSAFLPHCRDRVDLNRLLQEMLGELACGHEYVRGGAFAREAQMVNVGLLGANFATVNQRYKISKIFRGQNWNPGLRSPLSGPGINVQNGDVILAIDNQELTANDNIYNALTNKAGQIVLLKLKRGKKTVFAKVLPIANEAALRTLDWIEQNRKRVAKLSNNQLAYIYMPDTANAGQAAFDRDFFSQSHKAGLVIDERFNRGGRVADYVIEVLGRRRLCYWMTREEWVGQTPFAVMNGPKVMVINERAGSGGDALPWMFRKRKLGTLVGTRTWGGLVGISGTPTLMDGGSVTSAAFGIMNENGQWVVENVGVSPDVEVVEYPKDIIQGRDPQLEKAVEIALEQLKSYKKKPAPKYSKPEAR